jgi:hypothetical protein
VDHTSFLMWPLLDDVALRLADETVTYGELLLIGAATGLLEDARTETARALEALQGRLVDPSRADVRTEAVAFRQANRLQSGEDFRAWLASRQLTTAQWESHLRRSLAGRSPVEAVAAPLAPDELEAALTVDLACNGWWRKVADEAERYWAAGLLAGDGFAEPDPAPSGEVATLQMTAAQLAAALPSLGILDTRWCADRLCVLRSRQQALSEAEQRYSSDDAVAARVADHVGDWVRFVFDEIWLPTRAAASEAMLCSREDGLAPGEIASRANRRLEHHDLRRDRVPAAAAALLAGAMPGEALGPLESGDAVQVLWLCERRLPSLDDPAIRQDAVNELLAEALDRVAAGRAHVVPPL